MNQSIRETGRGGWAVHLRCASRLSFTLIDMNGSCGRRNGMASLSLAEPHLALTLGASDVSRVSTDAPTHDYAADISQLLDALSRAYGWKPVTVRIDRGLPQHSGFGSKTTTLMAVGRAYAAFEGCDVHLADIARLAKRGGTSGASVNLIDCGGYLVDGGHKNPHDFNDDPKHYLTPSRFAKQFVKPPIITRLDFPQWPILLITAKGNNLHGNAERDWYGERLPIPAEEARRTAHHVLMRLSPAIAEHDYEAFCEAVNEFGDHHWYKRMQLEFQADAVEKIYAPGRKLAFIDALGMSGIGPMFFAFTRDPESAVRWCQTLLEGGHIKNFRFVTANNRPCGISSVPSSMFAERDAHDVK